MVTKRKPATRKPRRPSSKPALGTQGHAAIDTTAKRLGSVITPMPKWHAIYSTLCAAGYSAAIATQCADFVDGFPPLRAHCEKVMTELAALKARPGGSYYADRKKIDELQTNLADMRAKLNAAADLERKIMAEYLSAQARIADLLEQVSRLGANLSAAHHRESQALREQLNKTPPSPREAYATPDQAEFWND